MKSIFSFLGITLLTSLSSYEIVTRSPTGEFNLIEVAEDAALPDIIQELQTLYGSQGEVLLDFQESTQESLPIAKVNNSNPRNFYDPITADQLQDIRYIVNTLGMSSLAKVTYQKSKLRAAGDRIDRIHPLRFFMTVFSDEEMKVSMHSLQGRSWVWKVFFSEVSTSLDTESELNNMTDAMITEFASNVGIEKTLIEPSIKKRQWAVFISTLIDKIPRNTQTDRYDQ